MAALNYATRYQRISIHAPLAGCDNRRNARAHRRHNFNPRTPCGVRRSAAKTSPARSSFQSTHPLRGATCRGSRRRRRGLISIHAPLAGCDGVLREHTRRIPHFNPRTPCGVRRRAHLFQEQKRRFQSTHPLRGATINFAGLTGSLVISIHAPLAGCDLRSVMQGKGL